MKKIIFIFTLFVLIPIFPSAFAEDMRAAAVKARLELEDSLARQKQRNKTIKTDKAEIIQAIQTTTTALAKFKKDITLVQDRIVFLQHENKKLENKASSQKSELNELSGAVRMAAGDLKILLESSMYTARNPERLEKLSPILDTKRFPGIDDMAAIAGLYLEEAQLTGGIDLKKMNFVSDIGEKVTGEVLTIGGFTAAYRLAGKTGFLNYSKDNFQLYALPAAPSYLNRRALDRYMDGDTDSVPIDISRGEALKQITHKQTLIDQIKKGGLLVWPILGLGFLAILIGIEKLFFLGKVHANTDKVMGRVNELAAMGKWEQCNKIVGKKKIPVLNVLRAGLKARFEDRETIESVLQESILKELPKLERFLPMLNIMGSISPLLGLLGTVTGMISTFHVITLYGTGDPRMLSGGISTALITTMIGLSVAIPIMLLYTFLIQRVEHVIGDMEEKAVALTNIIFREAN